MNKNTEYRVQSTDSFESQLSASARRLRRQSEKSLSTPETLSVTRDSEAMPIPSKRTPYWGWIATPTAAAIGLLVGLFIHRPAERQDNFTVPVVAATDHSGHSIADDGTDYSLLISL